MVSGLDCGLKGPGAFFCNGPNKLMGPQSYFNFWFPKVFKSVQKNYRLKKQKGLVKVPGTTSLFFKFQF